MQSVSEQNSKLYFNTSSIQLLQIKYLVYATHIDTYYNVGRLSTNGNLFNNLIPIYLIMSKDPKKEKSTKDKKQSSYQKEKDTPLKDNAANVPVKKKK